jgi:hypothetical protein
MQEIKVEVLSFFTLKFDLTHEDWEDMTQADKCAFIRNHLEANSEEIIDKSSITWK